MLKTTPRNSRNTGTETFSIIERKMEWDQQLRKDEMMRRKEEKEKRKLEERDGEQRFELLQLQHQQQMQQQMQQQPI